MRVQTVLIWVVVAGVLAAGVALVRSVGPGQDDPAARRDATWTVPIDPARVARLTQRVAGSPASAAERSGPDAWTLRWTDGAGRARSWRADPARVRAALRVLSTAEIIVAESSMDIEPVDTVEAVEADGRSVEIWFGQRAAGGQTPVVVLVKDENGIAEKRVDGRIGSSVPDAFVRTDWSAWRDPTLFDATVSGTQGIEIETRTHRVRLERGPRGWSVAEPFRYEADAAEVERVIGVLSSMRAVSFEPATDDAVSGLSEPIATVRVESRTGTRVLEVGRPLDSTQPLHHARISQDDAAAAVRVDATALSKITAAPEAYPRRTPLSVRADEIGRVRIASADGRDRLDARRDGAGWSVAQTLALPLQRDALDRLLQVMTAQPATAVSLRRRDEAPKGELATVRCETREGHPVAAVRLRAEQGPQGMRLLMAVELGNGSELVWTGATEEAKAVAAWAAALVSGA